MDKEEEDIYVAALKIGEACAKVDDVHERHRIAEGAVMNLLLTSHLCEIEQIGILTRALHQINQEMDTGPFIDEPDTLEDLR